MTEMVACDICREQIPAAALVCGKCHAIRVSTDWQQACQRFAAMTPPQRGAYLAGLSAEDRTYFERCWTALKLGPYPAVAPPPTSISPQTVALTLLGTLALIGMVTCYQQMPGPGVSVASTPPPIAAVENVAKVRDFVTKYPVGGGWTLDSVRAQSGSTAVHVAWRLPAEQATKIMSYDSGRQLSMVGAIACPGKLERLPAVVVHGMTPEGRVFIDVDCARWGG